MIDRYLFILDQLNEKFHLNRTHFLIDRMFENCCENDSSSNILIPLSNHRDRDVLSDTGTYSVEDENDFQDIQEKMAKKSTKRYINSRKENSRETFDIQGLLPSKKAIDRPVVDSNILKTREIHSSLLSSSSLLSFPEDIHLNDDKSSIDLHDNIQQQIKTAESFGKF